MPSRLIDVRAALIARIEALTPETEATRTYVYATNPRVSRTRTDNGGDSGDRNFWFTLPSGEPPSQWGDAVTIRTARFALVLRIANVGPDQDLAWARAVNEITHLANEIDRYVAHVGPWPAGVEEVVAQGWSEPEKKNNGYEVSLQIEATVEES